jgi:hypothetical protein
MFLDVNHVRRKPSSEMLRRVVYIRNDVSGELSTSIIKVIRIGELGTTLAVTNNWRTLRLLDTANGVPNSSILVTLTIEALSSWETSVLTRITRRIIPEDGILHSHCRENLESYIALTAGLCSRDVMCLLWSKNGVFISQETAFFIVTALKTSNLIKHVRT